MKVDELDHVIDHQFFVSDRTFDVSLADLGGETYATDHGQREAGHFGGLIDFDGQWIKVAWVRVDRHPATKIDGHITPTVEQQLGGVRIRTHHGAGYKQQKSNQ